MKPYEPQTLPMGDLDVHSLLPLIAQANIALGRYDGLLQGIPNPSVMLSPLTTQEAVLSSKIEGTQATVDEVLEQEAGLIKDGEKYKDIQEISNYRKALFAAREHLNDYPIRLSFVRELHRTLMDSVRGQNKTPGEFRNQQNWIGSLGSAIEDATFVPPSPLRLSDHLEEWERYLDYDDMDVLSQTAIVHAQFELLHPFMDGNGRIGRILIPLFLYQKRALSQPMFYLSEYLEGHRAEYYHRLGAISSENDWNGWVSFFLRATIHQSTQNSIRVNGIKSLYDDMKIVFQNLTRSQYAPHLLDAIFGKPIFRTAEMRDTLHRDFGIQPPTTYHLISQLKKAGILNEVQKAQGRRSAILCFPRLINLAEGREVL